MFLLWPDRPPVHKRRVRIATKAQLGIPPPEVSGLRVARMALAHSIPAAHAGLRPSAAASASAAADLPRPPGVVRRPAAVARRADSPSAPHAPEARALDVVVPPPSTRTAPAIAINAQVPTRLRRLFARATGPAFMDEDTPESELVVLLSAATMSAAERAERRLHGLALPEAQARLVAEVGDRAFGIAPLDGFWGDDEVTDALRLRLCRGGLSAEAAKALRWEGFYRWAGSRLDGLDAGGVPTHVLPDAAAALASTFGCRRTLERLGARLSAPGSQSTTGGRLALRCALSGTFAPSLLPFLLAARAQRASKATEVEAAWTPVLLALHAYRVASHDAGHTHVAASILATVVRDQVREIGRRVLPEFTPREWGAPPLTAEGEAAHRHVVHSLGLLISQHWWTYKVPWPAGSCGPDVPALERRLTQLLGATGWPVHDLFLDDALAVATGHALQGHTPSALATLAAVKTPAVFVPVRERLSRALERGVFDRERGPLVGTTLSRSFQGLLDRLRHTPDPSDFGSPDWRRDDLRGRLLSRLQKDGPKGRALALRTLLGTAFADLDRFWLAPSIPRHRALADLAAWIDQRAPLLPSDRALIMFLESQCRQAGA